MPSQRLDITPAIVKEAVALALKGSDGIFDFCDRLQPYFVLRVRGHLATWLVKTRDRSLKLGSAMPPAMAAKLPERRTRAGAADGGLLGLRQAREKAKREWANMGNATDDKPQKGSRGWTWGKLVEEYKLHISMMREDSAGKRIYPSTETQNDVRLHFGKKEVVEHEGRLLSSLDENWFEEVQEALHKAHGFHAYRKFRAYGQAALTWAASYKRKECGLTKGRWWLMAERRTRTAEEVERKEERDEALRARKENFKVKHLGMLLVQHERYCTSRTGNERVSPGVRWGLWWDSLTGHRRGSGTKIAVVDLQHSNELVPRGWGIAVWQPRVMKTQDPFALPIPPIGLHAADCCMRDWKEATKRAGLSGRDSKWVFASRVLQSEAGDIPASGSALANHLRNMRGLRPPHHRDVLRGIPPFSMHIIRSTMGDFILDDPDLPEGMASLMIGHEIPGDKRGDLDRISRTSKRWYVQAQRIPEKVKAMEAWSEALLAAYKAAGGIYPD